MQTAVPAGLCLQLVGDQGQHTACGLSATMSSQSLPCLSHCNVCANLEVLFFISLLGWHVQLPSPSPMKTRTYSMTPSPVSSCVGIWGGTEVGVLERKREKPNCNSDILITEQQLPNKCTHIKLMSCVLYGDWPQDLVTVVFEDTTFIEVSGYQQIKFKVLVARRVRNNPHDPYAIAAFKRDSETARENRWWWLHQRYFLAIDNWRVGHWHWHRP